MKYTYVMKGPYFSSCWKQLKYQLKAYHEGERKGATRTFDLRFL